jgi:eukaryotic-like serine/threonine-protein kinase
VDTSLAHALSERYVIERELGAGGMATVWLAQDLKHDRQVAIKVLHPHLAAVLGAERFLKEIRTTAQLQHPHILPLFDSGEAAGLLYYVMPYVDGESLRERIVRESQLPVADAVRIAIEVASALDYAHRRGVIHRDVKPENILLQDGRAVVADFGIAMAASRGEYRITETGICLGTPSYMSPEQALGERALDARSDVYAMGALLYEMLTGAPPFTGESAQAIVAKVITQTPALPSRARKNVPPYVDAAVLKALQKKPSDRFSSACELQTALEDGSGKGMRRIPMSAARVIVAAAAVIILAALAFYATHNRGPSVSALPLSIAAIPFQHQDTADSYLGDQIPAEILDALTHVPKLTVRPLASAPRFRNNHDLRAIARELDVTTLLTGSVTREGDKIRVTARLYDAARNQDMPTVSFTNSDANKFALQDSLSTAIASSFNLQQNSARTEAQLAESRAGRTTIPAAHDSLMLARFYTEQRTPASLTKAITMFRSAIRLDSTYADAWAGLAKSLTLIAQFSDSAPLLYYPEAKTDVQRALALDSTSAYAHTTYGFLKVSYDRDYSGARVEFAKALALDSMESSAWLFQSWYYLGVGHLDSALWSMRRGWRVDPAALIIGTRVGTLLYLADSLKASERQLESILKVDRDFLPAKMDLATAYADDHQCDRALAVVSSISSTLHQGNYKPYIWVRCKTSSEARMLLDSVETAAASGQFVNGFYLAQAYAALNDRARTYRWLNRALEDKSCCFFQLRTLPAFRSFRSDPEFLTIVRRSQSP